MTRYRLRDYVPGDDAARERNRLIISIATQVVPVFAILTALAVAVLMLYLPRPRYALDVHLLDCGPYRTLPHYGRYDIRSYVLLRIDGGRSYFLNGEPVAGDRPGGRLEEILDRRPDKVLVFRPTGAAGSYQDLFTALDAARGAGVKVLLLAPDLLAPMCITERHGP